MRTGATPDHVQGRLSLENALSLMDRDRSDRWCQQIDALRPVIKQYQDCGIRLYHCAMAGARAGPPPIPCPFDQPRPHRQAPMQRIVGVIEEGARAANAALGTVVR
jgi:hypothetical protein